jgi:hypothetical protein
MSNECSFIVFARYGVSTNQIVNATLCRRHHLNTIFYR